MSKKTIIIGTLSSLLVVGGVATAAGILVNAASKNDGLSLSEGIKFSKDDINNLINCFQSEIDKNKYTSAQFTNKIKDIVTYNLTLNGKNAFILVRNATYSNNEITISLNTNYEYSLAESYTNINVDNENKTIVISNLNLQFYESFSFTRLNDIYNLFNNIILDSKYTSDEFVNYFNEDVENIKKLVSENLYISDTKNIDSSLIEEINLVNNQVQIVLKTGYYDYSLSTNNNPNVLIDNQIMIIRNFSFYKQITIEVEKLNSLKSNIQNYIDDENNQFTVNEFISQVNSLSFKNEVANQLGILSTDINSISYQNNILKITPNAMQKFASTSVNNNLIVDDNIQVENFSFYESQTLTQTEKLYLALNKYIADSKYTEQEFIDKVNVSDNEITKIIQDNLLVLDNNESNPDQEIEKPINPDEIISYSFDNNQLQISLDTNYLKYDLESSDNVSINNGIVIVKNLKFYTSITIDDNKLNELKNNVQELIKTNKYTLSDFQNELNSLSFKNTIATYLGILSSNINSINFANNTLEITPLRNQKFVSSIPTNNNNNLVNDNIQISNLIFYDSFEIVETNNLFISLQTYINSNQDTVDEFKNKVNSNDKQIVSLIQNNLLVSSENSNKPIESNYITSFEFVNNQLEITLDINYLKYSLSSQNSSLNISLENGKLVIKNFSFYTSVEINNDKLNELKNNIQTLIQDNQYTLIDFQNQSSTLVLKNQIATYLGIESTKINSISYENDILKIIPQQNQKFVSTSINNSLIVDNNIQISNLKFYNSFTLTKLNNLYSSINNYINSNKLSSELFAEQVNSNNSKIQELIQNNLYVVNGNDSELINPKNILGISFNNNQLEITLESNYIKFITTSSNNNVVLENNKLIVKNFDYYEIIQIDVNNLNDLKANIQALINSNQWTISEFTNQLELESFKNQIANYLNISSSFINSITFVDSKLEITSPANKKFESSSFSSIINANDVIELSQFQFYTVENLSNLDELYNAINEYISNNKLTLSEFSDEVLNNSNTIKQLIIDNLKVNGNAIDPTWINSISFTNNDTTQQLEVTLNNYYVKYNTSSTNTVQIENNKLIVKNLDYFTSIVIDNTRLSNLKQNIQTYIQQSLVQFTSNEFKNQINSTTFKNKIAEYLNISSNAIGNVSFNNNTLEISPNSMYKFSSTQDNLIINNDGIIKVSNFQFYNLYNLTNLDDLYNAINEYIAKSSNKFTSSEFATNVSNSPNSIKQVIANNLKLSDSSGSQNVNIANITNVSYTNNQLEITLSNNYFKYEMSSNNNVTLEKNKVIVKNLKFCQLITFNNSDLTNLRTNIINLINNNKVDSNNISNYLSNQIYDLVKNINTVNNGRLEQYISTPTYSSNSIQIPLKSNVGLLKFATSSLSNVSISSNSISLNNITLYTPPTPSPVNWFTWDGTKIIGLSDLGKQQERIVLPEITTSLASNAFSNYSDSNSKLKNVDMSFTKITSIPSGNSSSSLFYNCSSLALVNLPNSVISIGNYAFYNCSSLISINIPNSVTSIGEQAFRLCSSLTSINIPNSVTSIGNFAFQGCSSLTEIILPNGMTSIPNGIFYKCSMLTKINIPNNVTLIGRFAFQECPNLTSINIPSSVTSIGAHAFNSCSNLTSINIPDSVTSIDDFVFYNCSSLTSINIPNSVTSIGNYAFSSCVSLKSINIPNSVTSIGNNAFEGNNNLVVYVTSNSVETLVKKVFNGIVINLSRP